MKKKNTFQLLLIIVFFLISAAFAFLIVQEGLLIGKQSAEINSIEALIGEQQILLEKMKVAEARSAELDEQLSDLQKLIPAEPDQNGFLVWVQRIASDESMTLTDVSFSEQLIEEGYVVIPIQLSLQGNFKSVLKLLSTLMYGERLVRVDDIDLSDNGGSLSIQISANLFCKPLPEG